MNHDGVSKGQTVTRLFSPEITPFLDGSTYHNFYSLYKRYLPHIKNKDHEEAKNVDQAKMHVCIHRCTKFMKYNHSINYGQSIASIFCPNIDWNLSTSSTRYYNVKLNNDKTFKFADLNTPIELIFWISHARQHIKLEVQNMLESPFDEDKLKIWGFSRFQLKMYNYKKSRSNGFYFRCLDIGEATRNGAWDEAEHRLFMKRALQVGVNDEWGLFSRSIPGRCGYQCRQYYHDLLTSGDIEDPNYFSRRGNDDENYAYEMRVGTRLAVRSADVNFSDEQISNFTKYAFKVFYDSSGVFGGQRELPKRHPKAPSEQFIQEMRRLIQKLEK